MQTKPSASKIVRICYFAKDIEHVPRNTKC